MLQDVGDAGSGREKEEEDNKEGEENIEEQRRLFLVWAHMKIGLRKTRKN